VRKGFKLRNLLECTWDHIIHYPRVVFDGTNIRTGLLKPCYIAELYPLFAIKDLALVYLQPCFQEARAVIGTIELESLMVSVYLRICAASKAYSLKGKWTSTSGYLLITLTPPQPATATNTHLFIVICYCDDFIVIILL